jgi:hypothetical protein
MTDRDDERRHRPTGSELPAADPNASSDEIMSRLGGRTLGEVGTTGGTTVGAAMQAEVENATIGGDHVTAAHGSDPGMGGRTARGNLGANLDEDVTGQPERSSAAIDREVEATHEIEVRQVLPDDLADRLDTGAEDGSRRPTGRPAPRDNQAKQ